jgi:hypothetical protein
MIPGASELAIEAVAPIAEHLYKTLTILATQVFGTLVVVPPDEFATIHELQDVSVVVHAITGKWRKQHVYLTSYQGLTFCAKSPQALELREDTLLVEAKKVFIPT